jgi:tRNA (uracil-5-)-methyltransferase
MQSRLIDLARFTSLIPRRLPAHRFARARIASSGMQGVMQSSKSIIKEIDDAAYRPQLEEKKAYVKGLFSDCDAPELEVFESQPRSYRMRSEFGVWHEGEDMYYIMHEKPSPALDESTQASTKASTKAPDTKKKSEKPQSIRVRMDQYPVASELVNRLMAEVRTRVLGHEVLKRKLFQVNFHTTRNEAMITLIYHKKLDEAWTAQATALRDELKQSLGDAVSTLHVIGRSRKQKICMDADHIVEVYDVKGRGELSYVQVEGAFSQPNSGTCAHMLSWAVSATEGCQDHDLLELYCGNGNFTTAVAANFRNVVATEVSKSSVAAAKKNFDRNGVTNVFVARMRSEEFTDGWKNGTDFKRLEGSNLKECEFKTLLVDPPRAGLDDETRLLLKEFERVLYISCNPETLKRDYESAKEEFKIERFAMFDQFPYTHHVECGLYLRRKDAIASSNKKQKLEGDA